MTTTGGFGGYADWADYLARRPRIPGPFGELFGVPQPGIAQPHLDGVWGADGVTTSLLSWEAGFGPRQHAYLLHPAGADPATLPGVLALHSHGGITCVGAARMVGTAEVPAHVRAYRRDLEGDVCVADDLAREGFTVLVPDAFGWGSRRFDLGVDDPVAYDAAARAHEHHVAKACALLDTSWAGMVAHDDLLALEVLAGRCAPGPIGVLGFSGGGGRAAILAALDHRLGSIVVIAMMTTLASLFPDHVDHSWLLHTRGLAAGPDLPGLLTSRGDAAVLVGYGGQDSLFPPSGVKAADALLRQAFAHASGSYTNVTVEAGHVFTPALQQRARQHLRTTLGSPARPQEPTSREPNHAISVVCPAPPMRKVLT